jgi:phosphoribosylformylglycinamidine synthase
MALAGGIGGRLVIDPFEGADQETDNLAASLFGETQGRFLVTEQLSQHLIVDLAREQGVPCAFIGWTGGDTIAIDRCDGSVLAEVALERLRSAHEGFFPGLMASEL